MPQAIRPKPTPPPAPPAAPDDGLVRFVSCVRDKPVTRFLLTPSRGTRTGNLFGASRVDGELVYDEQLVIGLTALEWGTFGRTYERNLRDGHLTPRTREDFEAQRKAHQAAKAEALNGAAALPGGEGT